MGRGSGGGGRTGGGGRGDKSGYGGSVETISYKDRETGNPQNVFSSHENPQFLLRVKPPTDGSDKQIDYANSLKLDAMRTIDRVTNNMTRRPGAIVPKIKDFRNRLLKAVNNDTSSRSLIDNLKDTKGDLLAISRRYGIAP